MSDLPLRTFVVKGVPISARTQAQARIAYMQLNCEQKQRYQAGHARRTQPHGD